MGIARRATLLLLPLFVVLGSGMVFAQQNSGGTDAVILTALAAPSDDNEASALASTITQGLDLLLRLSGGATVWRADFLSPNYDFSKSLDYYRMFKAKAGIFGSVTPDSSGGYTIKVDIWTSDSNSTKPT
ncbi:MAG TPA: hypothetical protein VMW69_14885 [Spirochaetia bacterium]|nr:hypothetical protein [Spirochaetia bacterium]